MLSEMLSIEEIQSARRVFGSVRDVRFDEIKYIDVTDRLGLVTVAAGVRAVAAFGFASQCNNAQMTRLEEILDFHGLLSCITRQIVPLSHKNSADVAGDLTEVFDQVDAESYSRYTGRLLWVFREQDRKDEIERAVAGEGSAGTLLEYPSCCVQRELVLKLRSQRVFDAAIISAVGREAAAVKRALREDLEVEIPGDSGNDPNLLNTRDRFPFVFHTACDECLSSDQSRTAELNRSYETLATKVDRRFHRLLLQISKLETAAGRIIDEATKLGARPGELEKRANQRLQEIFGESDRLYAGLFEA